MPITYTIRKNEGVVVSRHLGEVSDQELLDTYRQLYNDPDYQPSFNKVVDLRTTKSTGRSPDALRDIAQLIKSRYATTYERAKTAIIAPRDLSFGLARMYQVFSEDTPQETMVFREVQQALDWLHLSGNILDEE